MRERERIPSRLSVEMMTTGHITPEQRAASNFFPGFWDNYGRDGGYGASRYSDPEEDMVAIVMTRRVWDFPCAQGAYLDQG